MGIIRFLLALTVLVSHVNSGQAWRWIQEFGIFGNYAVNSFFIISGFYMALIFIEKYSTKHNSYRLFLSNRFLRIYPIYWIITILTIISNYLLFFTKKTSLSVTPMDIHQHGFFLYTSLANIVSDFTLLFRIDPLYVSASHIQRFPLVWPAWSLVIELIFYILAPFLVKRRFLVFLLLLVGTFSLHFVVIHYFVAAPLLFFRLGIYSFPAYFVFFLLGVGSYKLYAYLKKPSQLKKYLFVFILFGMITMIIWFKAEVILPFHKIELKEWLVYISLTATTPLIFLLLKNNRVDRFIGELSYPIYISHLFCIQIYQTISGSQSRPFQALLIVILLTLTTAILLIFFVNKPIDNYRQRRLLAYSKSVNENT